MQQPPSYELPPQYDVMHSIIVHRPRALSLVSHWAFMSNPRRAELWPRLQQPPRIYTILVVYYGNYLMHCPHCDSTKILPIYWVHSEESNIVICASDRMPPKANAKIAEKQLRKWPHIEGCIRKIMINHINGEYRCFPIDLNKNAM